MRFIHTSVAFLVAGVVAEKQCPRSVELLLLQDASTSFLDFADVMSQSVNELIDQMSEKLGKVRTSLAIFSDKPVPFRGNGHGRGYVGELDVCYSNRDTFPLGNDPQELEQGFKAIKARACEGGDFPEDPFEAMIYGALDPKVEWSSANQTYDTDGSHIVKVMLVVTDDHPHYEGEAYDGVYSWNPLAESDGDPRFFDADFIQMQAIYSTDHSEADYAELVKLHQDPEGIQTPRYQALLEYLGPAYYNIPQTHPGTFEANEDCRQYEYPALTTVGKVLNEEAVLPIFLITAPMYRTNQFVSRCNARGFPITRDSTDEEWMNCLSAVYKKDLEDAGFEHFIVGQFNKDVETLITQVVTLVDNLSRDVTCPEPTTPAPPTTPTIPTTTAEKTTVAPIPPVPASTTSIQTTSADNDSTTAAGNATTTPSGDRTTRSDADDATTTGSNDDATTTGSSHKTTTTGSDDDVTTTGAADQTTSGDDVSTTASSLETTTGSDNGTTISGAADKTTTTGSADDTTTGSSRKTTTGATGTGADDTSTTGGSDNTSGHIPFVPPVKPGSKAGTIAGAAGGAVAGTAAIAGVLYKKFGASLLGHSGPSDLGAVEQVEVPETQVEREAFEEVTMDMFQ